MIGKLLTSSSVMIRGSLNVNTNDSITEETVQVSKETQLVSSLSLPSFGRLGSSLSLRIRFALYRRDGDIGLLAWLARSWL
jgi:hypothetical protein